MFASDDVLNDVIHSRRRRLDPFCDPVVPDKVVGQAEERASWFLSWHVPHVPWRVAWFDLSFLGPFIDLPFCLLPICFRSSMFRIVDDAFLASFFQLNLHRRQFIRWLRRRLVVQSSSGGVCSNCSVTCRIDTLGFLLRNSAGSFAQHTL